MAFGPRAGAFGFCASIPTVSSPANRYGTWMCWDMPTAFFQMFQDVPSSPALCFPHGGSWWLKSAPGRAIASSSLEIQLQVKLLKPGFELWKRSSCLAFENSLSFFTPGGHRNSPFGVQHQPHLAQLGFWVGFKFMLFQLYQITIARTAKDEICGTCPR